MGGSKKKIGEKNLSEKGSNLKDKVERSHTLTLCREYCTLVNADEKRGRKVHTESERL